VGSKPNGRRKIAKTKYTGAESFKTQGLQTAWVRAWEKKGDRPPLAPNQLPTGQKAVQNRQTGQASLARKG